MLIRPLVVLLALSLASCGPTVTPSTAPGAEQDASGAPSVPLVAPGPQGDATPVPADCAITVTRIVPFTAATPGDVIEARSLPTTNCENSVLVWTLRSRTGEVLHAFATPYAQLVQNPAPQGLKMTLDRWVGVAIDDTSRAPAWDGRGVDFPKAFGANGFSPYVRPTYERIRAEKRPRICVETTYDSFVCLFYEAESGHADVLFRGGL